MEKARIPVKLHRRVCLLQTEDAVLAEEVLANRKLAQDVVGRIAERVLLIRPGRVEAVVQELQQHGPHPASGDLSTTPSCCPSHCRFVVFRVFVWFPPE